MQYTNRTTASCLEKHALFLIIHQKMTSLQQQPYADGFDAETDVEDFAGKSSIWSDKTKWIVAEIAAVLLFLFLVWLFHGALFKFYYGIEVDEFAKGVKREKASQKDAPTKVAEEKVTRAAEEPKKQEAPETAGAATTTPPPVVGAQPQAPVTTAPAAAPLAPAPTGAPQ